MRTDSSPEFSPIEGRERRITTLPWLISKIESHPTGGANVQGGEFDMATLKEAVEVMGRPTHHARRSQVRAAVVSLAAAVAITLSVSLATGNFAGGGVHALNPQPIPPGVHGDTETLA